MKLFWFSFAVFFLAARVEAAAPTEVEQWNVFEISLKGPADGNPFIEVQIGASFTDGVRSTEVDGFYDGDGTYRIRFMPDRVGSWSYETRSNRWPLSHQTGAFTVTAASPKNHGPVGVRHTYHFGYADGTPFHQVGTTSYTWTHRPEEIEEQTLRTLAASPFNKLRMAVLPQKHGLKLMPPPRWPFVGAPPDWDFTRFNPEFFQHLEKRIGQLRDLGFECDLILFHPYDNQPEWGFGARDMATDERYLRYVIARLAAYRNIWWSLANEYDFIHTRTEADWDRFFQIVRDADPYGHLRSIHNGYRLYNNNHPWVTHASIQNGSAVLDAGRAEQFREVWRKPVIFDEAKYEGDFEQNWGQLSGQEMVHRFWSGVVGGTYVGHSEYFNDPRDVVWLAEGGVLKGESPPRLAFLRKIMEKGPAAGIDPIEQWRDPDGERGYELKPGRAPYYVGGQPAEYYLVYFGRDGPTAWDFELFQEKLADGMKFTVEVIDTWAMTITPVGGIYTVNRKDRYRFADAQQRTVELPGKPYVALRIRRTR